MKDNFNLIIFLYQIVVTIVLSFLVLFGVYQALSMLDSLIPHPQVFVYKKGGNVMIMI